VRFAIYCLWERELKYCILRGYFDTLVPPSLPARPSLRLLPRQHYSGIRKHFYHSDFSKKRFLSHPLSNVVFAACHKTDKFTKNVFYVNPEMFKGAMLVLGEGMFYGHLQSAFF
jgi:hypothetical protein